MATPPVFTSGSPLTAAQMNAVGMWLIKSADYTSQTTVNIDSVFSSDFDNYCLKLNSKSGSSSIQLKFKTSSGVTTGTNYDWAQWGMVVPANSASSFAQGGLAYSEIGYTPGTSTVDIFGPNLSVQTFGAGICSFVVGSDRYFRSVGLRWSGTDVFVGMQLVFGASSSGHYDVYGYRD